MKMYSLEVGKLLKDGVYRYAEGTEFNIAESGAILKIFVYKPTTEELTGIREERFKYTFVMYDGVIYTMFKFGTLNWVDCPYTIHLSKHYSRDILQSDIAELATNKGLGLTVALIDASTGIITALRFVVLKHEFTINLYHTMLEQLKLDFSEEKHTVSIANCYRKYTTDDLVKFAKKIYM